MTPAAYNVVSTLRLDRADRELSANSWRFALAGRSVRRQFAEAFLKCVGDDDKFSPELWAKQREKFTPLIWFMLAELALRILLEWWRTRD